MHGIGNALPTRTEVHRKYDAAPSSCQWKGTLAEPTRILHQSYQTDFVILGATTVITPVIVLAQLAEHHSELLDFRLRPTQSPARFRGLREHS